LVGWLVRWLVGWLVLFVLHTLHPAFEDGTDRRFRNVGKPQSDAREIPKRTYTIFKTWRKFEIKNDFVDSPLDETFYSCCQCISPFSFISFITALFGILL
jgi:hypothetical protein